MLYRFTVESLKCDVGKVQTVVTALFRYLIMCPMAVYCYILNVPLPEEMEKRRNRLGTGRWKKWMVGSRNRTR